MSDTPETDKAERMAFSQEHMVPTEFGRRMERERDEAREQLNEWRVLNLWGGSPDIVHDFIKSQQMRIWEAQEIEKTCEQLERERDEARAEVAKLRQDAQREAEHHDRMVGELERLYDKNDKLRDIAEAHTHTISDVASSLQEFEAREVLKFWNDGRYMSMTEMLAEAKRKGGEK